jgi:hypothetical protein
MVPICRLFHTVFSVQIPACGILLAHQMVLLVLYVGGLLRVDLSFFERFDRGARVTRVTMPTARYLALGKTMGMY